MHPPFEDQSPRDQRTNLKSVVRSCQDQLDRHRAHELRKIRYLDECPDGDPRKAQAEAEYKEVYERRIESERRAMAAVDALLDHEDKYGDNPEDFDQPPHNPANIRGIGGL